MRLPGYSDTGRDVSRESSKHNYLFAFSGNYDSGLGLGLNWLFPVMHSRLYFKDYPTVCTAWSCGLDGQSQAKCADGMLLAAE